MFRRRGTFTLFTVLATRTVAQTGRRGVVGMLSGTRMAGAVSFHAACRFFSHAVWDVDRLGLAAARLVVERLLDDDAPVTVVVDDTRFRRWGRKVHHAFWTHDGAAQGGGKIARGNRWVVAGIAVRLPFCTAPVCLPVLFRLWAGRGSASPVELAGQLLGLVAVVRDGRGASVYVAEVPCLWCGSFGNTVGRCVLVREEGSTRPYDLALFSTDPTSCAR